MLKSPLLYINHQTINSNDILFPLLLLLFQSQILFLTRFLPFPLLFLLPIRCLCFILFLLLKLLLLFLLFFKSLLLFWSSFDWFGLWLCRVHGLITLLINFLFLEHILLVICIITYLGNFIQFCLLNIVSFLRFQCFLLLPRDNLSVGFGLFLLSNGLPFFVLVVEFFRLTWLYLLDLFVLFDFLKDFFVGEFKHLFL